jgi:dienelactone hydrolase
MTMKCSKLWVVACMAIGAISANAAPLTDLNAGQTGRIDFESRTPLNRWTLIRGQLGPQQTVFGDLLMPNNIAKGEKVPAVVLSHGSEGVHSTAYDVWAKELNGAGYAVFIVDSFKTRNIENFNGEKAFAANITGNIADSLYALKLLSTHPQIDSKRIYQLGGSLGGAVILSSAFPAIMKPIVGPDIKWAGSVAMYVGCNVRYRVDQYGTNPAPILMLLAEKDDNTPAKECVAYAESLAKAGDDVKYKVYAGAYHDWDRLNQRWVKFKHGVYADCDIEVLPNKTPGVFGSGQDVRENKPLTSGDELAQQTKLCAKMKYVTMEGNTAVREQSIKDILTFFNANK